MTPRAIHARRGHAVALTMGLGALVAAGCNLFAPTGNASATPTPAAQTPATPDTANAPTLTVDSAALEGIARAIDVTVVDAGAARNPAAVETVTVRVSSDTEHAGETIALAETGADSGVFRAQIALERLFAEDGSAAAIARNGKIAVYAEGGTQADSIVVAYGSLGKTITYQEPASTVTGLVKVGTVPRGGAAVQLTGNGGFLRSTTSRSDGSYAFHEVPSGTYTVVAVATGAEQLTSSVLVP